MTLHCPSCGKSFEKDLFPLGSRVACPFCMAEFDIAAKETLRIAGEAAGPGAASPGATVPEPAPGPPGPSPGETGPAGAPSGPGNPGAGRPAEIRTGDRLGGFRLEREIGRGGMGVVFLAVQESLNRPVAVKVLPANLSGDPQFVGRFEREAKSLANLSHPNIVGIIDKGFDRGHYFFVMEYVKGESLKDVIGRGEMTPQRALHLVPPLCEALEYAHSQGVVHRDIKPGNILIDERGRPKIADFGLARIVKGEAHPDGLTRTDLVMGTPEYMAPEQRTNPRDVDGRADIFSLGVVLYEMLTGTLPVGRFEPPSRTVHVDVRLDEVVLKALERDRERRYQRASEIGSAITRISDTPAPGPAAVPVAAAAPSAGPESERGTFRTFPLSAGCRIEVRAQEAGVVLKGVQGPAEVSGDAAFAAARVGERLEVNAGPGGGRVVVGVPEGIPVDASASGGGEVRLSDLAAPASLSTERGGVTVEGHRGDLAIRTGSGNLTLRRIETRLLRAEVGTADVLVDGLALRPGSAEVKAEKGNIRLNVVSRGSSFTYGLATGAGTVSTTFGRSTGNWASGTVGSGVGRLRVETGSGDIVLGAAGDEALQWQEEAEAERSRSGRRWRGFFHHLGAYAIVNAALLLVNGATSPQEMWMLWVAVPWGGALALHFWGLLVRAVMGKPERASKVLGDWAAAPRSGNRRSWGSVGRHLGVYAGVNAFLAFVNFHGPGWGAYPWFLWAAVPWGVFLAAQTWFTLVDWLPRAWSGGDGEWPPEEEVANRRDRVSSRWSHFFESLGTYAIVNALLAVLFSIAGVPGVGTWVLACWGLPLFLQFWGAAVETAEYVGAERRFRRPGAPGAGGKARFPLLYPLVLTAAVLLSGLFGWAILSAVAHVHPAVSSFGALAAGVQAHPACFLGILGGFLALAYGFYFGTGAPTWVRGLFLAVAGMLLVAVAFTALAGSATVVVGRGSAGSTSAARSWHD